MDNNWLERFRNVYKPLLKDKYDEFENNLSHQKLRHVRLNSSRNINYLEELNELSTLSLLEGYKHVYMANTNGEKLSESITFQTGGAYIMNPSSVAPAAILTSFLDEESVVMDVSSAPGGKTTAISDMLNRKGLVIANEISSQRLKSLHFNLEKYGAYNVKTVSMDGRLLPKFFTNSMDGILLDAPCSNENKIFRNKTVQNTWNKDLVLRMAELQFQLIKSAFECLKPGGVLVYSTCTLSLEENEMVIDKLLTEYDDSEIIPVRGMYGHGLLGKSRIDESVARIMPDELSTDGFFAAAIRKKGEHIPYSFKKTSINSKEKDFFEKNFPDYKHDHIAINTVDRVGYIETAQELFSNIKFKRRGLTLYKDVGKTLEPSCQSVWEFGQYVKDSNRFNINIEDTEKYMKGFDILDVNNYNGEILFYNSIPVGFGKKINDSIKNKLDRYFLYGKNIEY